MGGFVRYNKVLNPVKQKHFSYVTSQDDKCISHKQQEVKVEYLSLKMVDEILLKR